MMALLALLMLLAQQAAADLSCRPQGPIVPPPLDLDASPAFRLAADRLAQALDGAVNGSIPAGWAAENGSFSVALVSVGQRDPKVPLWEYHHLARGNVRGTRRLDRDSQYLIGSISKVVTGAVVIRSGLHADDPVTKYLPQLSSPSSPISWGNITLGHLGSQLSGIPPNFGFSEFYFLQSYFQSLGFPPINDTDFPPCGVIGLNQGCSKEQLLKAMLTLRPVAEPMAKPVYSNIAFTILAYAVEAATGMNYTQQLAHFLTGPFNMTNTFPSPGNDSLAVIPPMENTWGSPYGDSTPGGGLVSTTSDLSAFAHAILTGTVLQTRTRVREWLQPAAFAGSGGSLVGTPWEVYVPAIGQLTPRRPRSVPVYAKGGAAYGYSSRLAVVPELGVGLVVLTAGAGDGLSYIWDAALSVLAPAVDDAAHDEAARLGHVGRFASPPSGAAAGAAASAAIAWHDDGSLRLAALARNGSDVLAALPQIWSATLGAFIPGSGSNNDTVASYRIFPAGVSVPGTVDLPPLSPGGGGGGGQRAVVREDWRIWWETAIPRNSGLPGAGLSEHDCLLWTFADWLHYGGEAVERIVFVKDRATGEVLGVEVPFLRTGLLQPVAAAE
ncbi:hypothetical protein RB601_003117 [Gaeumannomyces tritici]